MPVQLSCNLCKNIFLCKPSHAKKRVYCSKHCASVDYKTRLKSNSNPNFKNSSVKKCISCGISYNSYSKTRKYCSHECYVRSDQYKINQSIASEKAKLSNEKKPKKVRIKFENHNYPRKPRIKKPLKINLPNKTCLHCKEGYFSYNKNRKYCSYACHIASGGSFRAGMEAAITMKKYKIHKKDFNHKDIVDVFHKMAIPFYDLSAMGCGIPDGIAWVKSSWQFVEIKNPNTAYGKRGLNKNQKKWIEQWQGGAVYIVSTIDEAILFCRGDFSKLKSHSGLKT